MYTRSTPSGASAPFARPYNIVGSSSSSSRMRPFVLTFVSASAHSPYTRSPAPRPSSSSSSDANDALEITHPEWFICFNLSGCGCCCCCVLYSSSTVTRSAGRAARDAQALCSPYWGGPIARRQTARALNRHYKMKTVTALASLETVYGDNAPWTPTVVLLLLLLKSSSSSLSPSPLLRIIKRDTSRSSAPACGEWSRRDADAAVAMIIFFFCPASPRSHTPGTGHN